MTRTIYRTATSLNGFVADENHSLSWLFAVETDVGDDHQNFLDGVGAIVEGSTTYEWVLRETDVLDRPDRWQDFYGDRPTFVLTSRDLPVPGGADVRFRSGPVAGHLAELREAAGIADLWVVGGGDVAGQFVDAGALDEVVLTIAPATLTGGAPLLPRRIGSDRLTLRSVTRSGQFVQLIYDIAPGPH